MEEKLLGSEWINKGGQGCSTRPEKALARYDRYRTALGHLALTDLGRKGRFAKSEQWESMVETGDPPFATHVCVWREKSPMMKENRSADRTLLAAGSRWYRAWIYCTVPYHDVQYSRYVTVWRL